MFSFYINKFKVKNLVLNPKNSNKSFKKILKHFKRSAAIGHIRILGVGLELACSGGSFIWRLPALASVAS